MKTDVFGARSSFDTGFGRAVLYRLDALDKAGVAPGLARLPFSIKVLLEAVLRSVDGELVTAADVRNLAAWNAAAPLDVELPFMPARVILQDFTGVPAVVDLASMRAAVKRLGGDPKRINPLVPVDLVVDHSVQVDAFGTKDALRQNAEIEFARNRERYEFLRWGQQAFQNFRVVPPATGIVHQVNLEYLAKGVLLKSEGGESVAMPDTLVGTDSHTTMINGLGVLGWGVGGIEAEAAMLGQPLYMVTPQVVGFRLAGRLREGTTATDLVLTVTQMLRKKGVVEKFVEFYGPGLAEMSLADRATIANMAPEYGATCGFFPVDDETLALPAQDGPQPRRGDARRALHEGAGPLPHGGDARSGVQRHARARPRHGRAEPRRAEAAAGPRGALGHEELVPRGAHGTRQGARLRARARGERQGGRARARRQARGAPARLGRDRGDHELHQHLEPVGDAGSGPPRQEGGPPRAARAAPRQDQPRAGLEGRDRVPQKVRAAARPRGARLPRGRLRLHHLHRQQRPAAARGVEGGERGQAGRGRRALGQSQLRGPREPGREGQLPRLAAARRGLRARRLDGRRPRDRADRHGRRRRRRPARGHLAEPGGDRELEATVGAEMFEASYGNVFDGNPDWNAIPVTAGDLYAFRDDSTYIQEPPFFQGLAKQAAPLTDIVGARVLAVLGDSVTTDHISPAGDIALASPAGRFLGAHGVEKKDFNSYGSRRGNDRVMVRGTFANIRLKNAMVPGVEGGVTIHVPSGERMDISDAAERYRAEGTPLVVIAGKEYGSGSSRDWAAKGPLLLGVRAVIAQSYERIHRSNLVGMGVLPLQWKAGESAESHGLDGSRDAHDPRPRRRAAAAAGRDGGGREGRRHEGVARGDRPPRHPGGDQLLQERRHPADGAAQDAFMSRGEVDPER